MPPFEMNEPPLRSRRSKKRLRLLHPRTESLQGPEATHSPVLVLERAEMFSITHVRSRSSPLSPSSQNRGEASSGLDGRGPPRTPAPRHPAPMQTQASPNASAPCRTPGEATWGAHRARDCQRLHPGAAHAGPERPEEEPGEGGREAGIAASSQPRRSVKNKVMIWSDRLPGLAHTCQLCGFLSE